MLRTTIFTTLAVSTTAMGLFAQDQGMTVVQSRRVGGEGVVMAQGAVGVMGLSGDPGNFRFFTQEFSANGKAVTGAPYSADEKTESTQTLADGTKITNATTSRVYRDSQGRTRTEMSLPGLGPQGPAHTMIRISDPVAGVSYSLDPDRKIAVKMPAMAFDKMRLAERLPQPPPGLSSRTTATATADGGAYIFREGGTAASKHEDLGANVLEGVNVSGSRDTSTIEAGAIGNDRPITISSERWYSPELQIEVKSVHNDPRIGQTTHTVTNISRSEPDVSLFQVPPDYKVEEPNVQIRDFEYHHQ